MRKLLILILLLAAFLLNGEIIKIEKNSGRESVEYSSQDPSRIEIRFNLLEYELEKMTAESSVYSNYKIPGESELLLEGKPNLPVVTRLFVVPDAGDIEVAVNLVTETSNIVDPVYPAQPLRTESSRQTKPFTKDEAIYNSYSEFPDHVVVAGEPVICRDLRLIPVTFYPFQYVGAQNELKINTNINVTITINNSRGSNEKISSRKPSRAFEKLYSSVITNYRQEDNRNIEYQQPSYLFIYPDDDQIEGLLQDLIEWKHQKGYAVTAVSTAETGSDQLAIKDYIQNAYDNWEIPPEYVCLVGDANGAFSIPAGHYVEIPYDGENDHVYSLLEGNDILSDVIVGRLSFNSLLEFMTILSKILNYEKTPFLGDNEWFNRAIMVGDPSSSGPSCVDTKLAIVEMMQEFSPNMTAIEIYSGDWVNLMDNALNNGASYFNYRGTVGVSGWRLEDVNNLNNGYMLPFVVILTCLTGDFEGITDCMSERFLKAGSPTNPKGGIAAVSTATGYTHTCFNNLIDAGIFTGIFADEIYNPGGALVKAKIDLYNNYPDNPYDFVNKLSHWNNLMGDPGLELWTGQPEALTLHCESTVPLGSNNFEVEVLNEEGNPVEDAWVTILKGDDEVFTSGYTDDSGYLRLLFDADIPGTASLTVSKHNYIPEITEVEITEVAEKAGLQSYSIDDDMEGNSCGNNDGMLNSGETIELAVSVMNYGYSGLNGLSAQISTNSDNVELLIDSTDLGSLEPGAAAEVEFLFSVDENTLEGTEIRFDLLILDNAGNEWDDLIYLVVSGPVLEVSEIQIEDGNNNILEPGETADLFLFLENIGSVSVENVFAQISCYDPRITVNNLEIEFGDVDVGSEAVCSLDPLGLYIDHSVVPGAIINFNIEFYNEQGYQQFNCFSLQAGSVSATDPLGPDQFGHYIYDSTDLGYTNTMLYDWIEIDPQYGGNGNVISLIDYGDMGASVEVQLPFSFIFYGREYTSLTICTNGWIAPGDAGMSSFMNWNLPGPLGPSPMIAVFWDDLKLGDMEDIEYVPNGGQICYFFEESENVFIVEWSRLRNQFDDSEETFQAVIYDPYEYPTSTGDSQIKLQYLEINNSDQGSYETMFVEHGQYATVGLEDHFGADGLQYTYDNAYNEAAMVLEDFTALTITGSPVSTENPHIIVSELQVFDSNDNGQIDYSEYVELSFGLNNLDVISITDVTASLTTDDPYLQITESYSAYSDITPGTSEFPLNNFAIQVANICPDGHLVNSTLSVYSSEGNVQIPVNWLLNSPSLALVQISTDDGNNNLLDPGESVPAVFSFLNSGGSSISDLTVEIDFSSDDVWVATTSAQIGNISAGTTGVALFEITANDQLEIGSEITVNWNLEDPGGYGFSGQFPLYISQNSVCFAETFETFLPEGWELTGGYNWVCSYDDFAGGNPPEALFWGGLSNAGIQRLISPEINTCGSNRLLLNFYQTLMPFAQGFQSGIATTVDGEVWNDIIVYEDTSVYEEFTQLIIETSDVGSESFRLCFYFQGDTEFIEYWAIDNVELLNEPIGPQSFIVGNITLQGTQGEVEETIITAGEFITDTDANGYYVLQVDPGVYDVRAYLPGYLPETQMNVNINQLWTNHQVDFSLYEATIEDPPQNLNYEVDVYNILLQWDPPGSESRDDRDLNELSELKEVYTDGLKQHTRFLEGYKIYRNNEYLYMISDNSILEYLDPYLDAGEYEYSVTALYEDGESVHSNQVTVTLVLPTPENVTCTSTPIGGNVIINWQAPNDYVTGYRLYRNDELINEITGNYYFDAGLEPGCYNYGLSALYGEYESEPVLFEVEITSSGDNQIPAVTKLEGNHPNPFNPETEISYQLAEKSHVTIEICNIKGQLVRLLADEFADPGIYHVIWDGKDEKGKLTSSGIYYYRMTTEKYSSTRKMIMLK